MATVRWVGGATAVAQVDTLTVGGTIEADDVFTITVTGENGDTHEVEVTAGSTDADTVATTIAAAWNADTHYLCTPVTAAAVGGGSGELTLTADTAGMPFYVSVATTEAGGGAADDQTFEITSPQTTANAGPYDWNTAANWDTGTVPVGGDTVYVEGATILYGLDQSSLGTNVDLYVNRSQVGSNPSDGRNAPYLQIPCTALNINEYVGPGSVTQSGPVMVDTGDADGTRITVFGGSSNATTRLPSVWLKCNNDDTASDYGTKIDVRGGYVGIAYDSGSTSAALHLKVSGGSVYAGDGFSVNATDGWIECSGGTANIGLASQLPTLVNLGGTVTVRRTTSDVLDVTNTGGTMVLRCGAASGVVTVYGGNVEWIGDSGTGAYGTVYAYGGTFHWHGTQDITNLYLKGGIVDARDETNKSGYDTRAIATIFDIDSGSFRYYPGQIIFTASPTWPTVGKAAEISFSEI